MDLMDRLQDLVPARSRGLDAGCGAGARDVFFYRRKGYDIYGVDAIEENIKEARRIHPEIAQRVSAAGSCPSTGVRASPSLIDQATPAGRINEGGYIVGYTVTTRPPETKVALSGSDSEC